MEIIYICPARPHPVGGIKVIYRHSELLNQLGYDSSVYHPEDPNFQAQWFSHKIRRHTSNYFNANSSILVIPEVWIHQFSKICTDNGLRYANFIQNAYLTVDGVSRLPDHGRAAFENSSLILSISEDTSDIISLTYPSVGSKIVRLLPSIGPDFRPSNDKRKTITYMPRRLSRHSKILIHMLSQHINKDWEIVAIENKTENEVAELLSHSSIFLSFSDLEGFGLPPIEAAFAGNLVVGYSGQGGNEFFLRPIFRKIENGDFSGFYKEVQAAIVDVEAGILNSPRLEQARAELHKRYSPTNESEHITQFARRAEAVLAGA